jgi:deoxyribose-phosphate aldolase
VAGKTSTGKYHGGGTLENAAIMTVKPYESFEKRKKIRIPISLAISL